MDKNEDKYLIKENKTSCFLLHSWGKWKTYVRRFDRLIDGKLYHGCGETRQRRSCTVCGYSQDKFLCYGDTE